RSRAAFRPPPPSSTAWRPWPRISGSSRGSAVTTATRSGLKAASVAVSTRPNSRRLSAARSSTPNRPASRDLPARNGLTGMTAQQSITLFHAFHGQVESQFHGIVRQTALVVERPHHSIADLDPAAERFDGWSEIAVDAVDEPAVDQPA